MSGDKMSSGQFVRREGLSASRYDLQLLICYKLQHNPNIHKKQRSLPKGKRVALKHRHR